MDSGTNNRCRETDLYKLMQIGDCMSTKKKKETEKLIS